MSNTVEEVTEMPLVYPLISVTIRTVSIVNGRRIDNECEEVINTDRDMAQVEEDMGRLAHDFCSYVDKIIAHAGSPQGRDALQSILDKSEQDRRLKLVETPVSPPSEVDPDQGTPPLDPLVA